LARPKKVLLRQQVRGRHTWQAGQLGLGEKNQGLNTVKKRRGKQDLSSSDPIVEKGQGEEKRGELKNL